MSGRWLIALALLLGLGACDQAIEEGPSEALVALNNRGVGLMGYFDYPGAREVFEQVVAADPTWIDARVNLAIATLNRQQEGDEARTDAILQEVLAEAPDHLRAHFVAGLLRLYEGAQEEALAHFQRVAQADPADAYAAYYTGQLLAADDPEAALRWFERAIDNDPYLRSAYYGASSVLRRLRRRDDAAQMQQRYLRLESNPRARLAEFKYTRMGPRANALAVPARPAPAPAGDGPDGPVFDQAEAVLSAWQLAPDASVTTADLDGDGQQDLFVTAVRPRSAASASFSSLVLRGEGGGAWQVQVEHPLSGIAAVGAAAWADIDNDGDVDAYLCREGVDQLWYQTDADWEQRPESIDAVLPGDDCRDVAAFDADHDGDVDIFVVGSDANELLNNDGDGSFRALAATQGLAGAGGGRQVVVLDIDADRDTDIAVLNDRPPHSLFINDRLWQYRALAAGAFVEATAHLLSAGDADADGLAELYLLDTAATPVLTALEWQDGAFQRRASRVAPAGARTLGLGDYSGDGAMELLIAGEQGLVRLDALALIEGRDVDTEIVSARPVGAAIPVLEDAGAGPGLVATQGDALAWYAPGTGRHPFAAFSFVGRESDADAMRSNAAGIGTRLALRRGEYWSVSSTFDNYSVAGQSLQPVSLGLGRSERADFIAIDWSDGVFQTELDLPAGALHRIAETQRQLASCPVLFAWNGEEFDFVTDLLGVGGIGFLLAPGQYSAPRPWERMLLEDDQLVARDGRLALKLTEPMEEVAYVDQLQLQQVLVPPGWGVLLDERHSTDPGRPPGGDLHWYRELLMPVAARNDRGEEVVATLREADGAAAPVGPRDDRFLGRLRVPHVLTVEFPPALGAADGRTRWLLADGWVEYPYSQTLFAAWQANVTYDPPSLEASTDGRVWHDVARAFGYPAGMPRRMALHLDALPQGTRYLRLSGNLEIYWDRLRVALVEPAPERAEFTALALRRANLSQVGFPRRTTHAQRRPDFDYAQRQAFWDTRYMRGAYTAFGDVRELVMAQDDAFALVGAGEELHAEFDAGPAELARGWTRHYLLTTAGWAKDMDLYTRDGDTVGPMPHRSEDPAVLSRRDALHARFHTRPLSGK